MKAAIYARYSGDKQREASIDDQVRNCTQYAGREGLQVVQVYHDKAMSGASAARPGYQSMLAAATQSEFGVLLVDDLSRLSRDDIEMKRVLRKLVWQGMRIVGVSDGYDSARKGHKIHAGFKGLMNEMFLDDLRDRTHRGMTGQAIKGFNCGGRTYGYKNVPIEDPERKDAYGRPAIVAVRYEIDPVQAEVVKRIHEWYAAGLSYRDIAIELNRGRIPSSRGSSWAMTAIKVILENEMYDGRLIWNRKEWVKNPETGKRTYKERPREEWIVTENQQLRIVDENTVRMVRRRQKKNREAYTADHIKPLTQRYLFSGILACAHCGGNFIIVGQGRYGCANYKTRGSEACSNTVTVSRHIVEKRILQGIKDELLRPGHLENFKKKAAQLITEHNASGHADTLKQQLKEAQRERDNIMAAIRQGIVTDSTKSALETAEATVQEIGGKLKSASNIACMLPRAVERYKEAVKHLEEEFGGHVHQAREIIKSLVGEKIKIHRRGDHLEAELQDNTMAVLAANSSDLGGCGGRICTESNFISLEPRLSDNTPICHRKPVFRLVKS